MAITPETSTENIAKLSDPNRGRIVAVSLSPDGQSFRLFTGMGGRSTGSKNRYYKLEKELVGDGNYIRTAIHDPSIQAGDPSATLYIAQRSRGLWHVASNGEQTDGFAVALAAGSPFKRIQEVFDNEGPDNAYTARITAAVYQHDDVAYLGKVVQQPSNPEKSYHQTYMPGFFDASLSLNPGEGYFLVTYDGKGGTEPSYDRPLGILLPGSLEDSMDLLWENWDPNTRANLVGKEIDRGSQRFTPTPASYSFRSIHPGRA